jgi:hypothetical protein
MHPKKSHSLSTMQIVLNVLNNFKQISKVGILTVASS